MRPIFDPEALPVIETDSRRALSTPRMPDFIRHRLLCATGVGARADR
jgi:hypothetical protein